MLKPTLDRIIVRRLESPDKTAGGIIIPEKAKETPTKGEVLAVGPGKKDRNGNRIPMTVKPGDKILFKKYIGVETKFGDETLLIMKDADIDGVLEDAA